MIKCGIDSFEFLHLKIPWYFVVRRKMAQKAVWFSAPLFLFDSIPIYPLSKQSGYTGMLPIFFWRSFENQSICLKKPEFSVILRNIGYIAQFFCSCGCRDPPLLKFDCKFQKNGGLPNGTGRGKEVFYKSAGAID